MIKFYLVVATELLFLPFLYLFEIFKRLLGRFLRVKEIYKVNKNQLSNEVLYVIHEWAGYSFTRKKTIKYINREFECGLMYQLTRLKNYEGNYKLRKILTISDCNESYLDGLKNSNLNPDNLEIYPVKNTAMDFTGYNFVINDIITDSKDRVVFLTNTSVDSNVSSFIDEYVKMIRENPTIGLIGTSYSTKVYQSLIQNNFRPHLQSFFLVSRLSVLREVINFSGGVFPGSDEDFKLAIIRFGEVRITEIVQEIGYKVCVVHEDGVITTIPKSHRFYNGYYNWTLPYNDYRLHSLHPNRINLVLKPQN